MVCILLLLIVICYNINLFLFVGTVLTSTSCVVCISELTSECVFRVCSQVNDWVSCMRQCVLCILFVGVSVA